MNDEKVPAKRSARFRAVDILLIVMMILPLVLCLTLKVLYKPASEGIEISGAMVYLTRAFRCRIWSFPNPRSIPGA